MSRNIEMNDERTKVRHDNYVADDKKNNKKS